MRKEEQLQQLVEKITSIESKVADTKYFAETALCLETKQIYLNTLKELSKQLAQLYKTKNELLAD